MYDWANSAYALVITSAIFPAYYNSVTRGETGKVDILGVSFENTAIYSISLGLAFGVVALISPFLSSLADYTGKHKWFLRTFCYLGSASCMALFLFDGTNVVLGLVGLMGATIGYAGSLVYYNAYLPTIASESEQDRVSARGYAFGYLGASTLLIINLILILNQHKLGVEDDTFFPRLSFLMTGLWWIGFAQIALRKLPLSTGLQSAMKFDLWQGYRQLQYVWNRVKHIPVIRRFLVSFFFYIMGVQTVMFMAASFGEKEVHLSMDQLITVVLCLEYVGIGGAFLFSKLSKRIGNLNALIVAVIIWVLICAGAYFIETPVHFYVAAAFIGLVMGGIQALSRSTFAKLIPDKTHNAGYFSFYDVCERLAMMFGLAMFGYLDQVTGSMRSAIVALVLFFMIGAIALFRTKRAPVLER